jgi:hypothetical protein
MSNITEMLKELPNKCDGSHQRQILVSDRAKEAEIYPEGLCRAICVGLAKAIRNSAMKILKLVDVSVNTKVGNNPGDHNENDNSYRQAWDDVSGEELGPGEVAKARRNEMKYIDEKEVWRIMPRAEAMRRGVKIIQTRWIDINKGDKARPSYRSRLAAEEFRDGDQDGLFSSTPPLEALKLLISMTAAVDQGPNAKERSSRATMWRGLSLRHQ